MAIAYPQFSRQRRLVELVGDPAPQHISDLIGRHWFARRDFLLTVANVGHKVNRKSEASMQLITTPAGQDVSSFFATRQTLQFDIWEAERKLDQAQQALALFDAEMEKGPEDWIAADASLYSLWKFWHDDASRSWRVTAIERLEQFVAKRRAQLAECGR